MKVKAVSSFSAFLDGDAREIKPGDILEIDDLHLWLLRLGLVIPLIEDKRERAVVEPPEKRIKRRV